MKQDLGGREGRGERGEGGGEEGEGRGERGEERGERREGRGERREGRGEGGFYIFILADSLHTNHPKGQHADDGCISNMTIPLGHLM